MSIDDQVRERTPHIDEDWVDELVIELRLKGVSGKSIGGALLEVEAHMAEHGGEVFDVFGEAKVYAASLELPDEQRWSLPEVVRLCLVTVLAMVGTTLLIGGTAAVFTGGVAEINLAGLLVQVGIVVVAVVALAVWSELLLRFIAERTVAAMIVVGALVAIVVAVATFMPGPVAAVPAWIGIALGGLLLLPFIVNMLLRRTGKAAKGDDPILFPQPGR